MQTAIEYFRLPNCHDTVPAGAPSPSFLLARLRYLPDSPELEILIAGAGKDKVSGRTDAAEEHAALMRVLNLRDAFKGRVRVHENRVIRVAVRREDLLLVRCKLQ